VKPLNAHIRAIFAASDIHNDKVFHDIAEKRTTILIHVVFCAANSNGLALTCIGLTLRIGILTSTRTTYWASLQGLVVDPRSSEEIYHKISPVLPLNPTGGVRLNSGNIR
jgi:hypothetical protein